MPVYELRLATLGPVHARDAQAHWRQVGRVADSGTETLEFNHTGQVCALVVAMRSNPSSSPSGYRSPIMRPSRSAEPPPVGARNRRLCSGLDQAVVDGVRSRPQSARRPGDVAVGRGGVGGGGPRGQSLGWTLIERLGRPSRHRQRTRRDRANCHRTDAVTGSNEHPHSQPVARPLLRESRRRGCRRPG